MASTPMNRGAYGHSCHLLDASPRADPRQGQRPQEALALFDSYRRLADVFHEVLSEQSLDALLKRIADTLGELIPHDDLAVYEADETTSQLGASSPAAPTPTR